MKQMAAQCYEEIKQAKGIESARVVVTVLDRRGVSKEVAFK